MKENYRVLVVDDHELARSGIDFALSQQEMFSIVKTIDRGGDAIDQLKDQHIDIVLLDLNLPDVSGIDVLIELTSLFAQKVVILTGESRANDFQLALKVGALGIVSKSDPVSCILEALQNVVLEQIYLSPQIKRLLGEREKPEVSLSPRQFAILHLLANGETNKEIGYRLGISPPTVSFHLRELREKLGVDGNKKILNEAANLGLLK